MNATAQRTDKKIYVCMTDSFMSGWGRAKGLRNRLAIEVNGFEEADKLLDYVQRERGEMQYVTISQHRPRERFGQMLQFKTREGMPMWFQRAGITD